MRIGGLIKYGMRGEFSVLIGYRGLAGNFLEFL